MATPTRGTIGSPSPFADAHRHVDRPADTDPSFIATPSLPQSLEQLARAARTLVGARQVTLELFADRDTGVRRTFRAGGPEPSDSEHRERSVHRLAIRAGGHQVGRLSVLPGDDAGLSAAEEEVLSTLAATAGSVVGHAQRYWQSQRTQEWLRAVADISRGLITSKHTETLQRIAERVQELADADAVSVIRPAGDDQVEVVAASGRGAAHLLGFRYARRGSLAGEVMLRRRGLMFDGAAHYVEPTLCPRYADCLGSVMAVPLVTEHGTAGAVLVGRGEQRRFCRSELELAENFAGQAALALELAEARTDQDRLRLLRDRDRIARDLHDRVIQRLFAIGLELQSIATVTSAGPGARLVDSVGDLDETIREIRTTIFALRQQNLAQPNGLRGMVLSVVADLSAGLRRTPEVIFVGPLDTFAEPELVSDVEAVVREGLTNVVRHAEAQRVAIRVEIAAGELEVFLSDDGIGIADLTRRRSGLANLRRRAEQHDGSLSINSSPGTGTTLSWIVPVGP